MTTLNRVVLRWAGPQIKGNAVTVLHYSASDNPVPPVAAIQAAFQNATLHFPSGVTVTVPASGDQIDDTTGNLTGVWSVASENVATMSGPAKAAAGVGACISWTTGGIVNGTKGPRKLRGRTFLVPLIADDFDVDGTIATGALTTLRTLASQLQASGPLAIWHRPTTVGGSDGNSYGVITNKVSDHVAFLSSRRD